LGEWALADGSTAVRERGRHAWLLPEASRRFAAIAEQQRIVIVTSRAVIHRRQQAAHQKHRSKTTHASAQGIHARLLSAGYVFRQQPR
jgi:hypothetical protein